MARVKLKHNPPQPPPPPEYRLASVFDDPPRKNVFLLSCMDQRMLDEIVWFMNSLNLCNRYDQVALAGGAMGAHQLPKPDLPNDERWRAVFFLHLEAAINVLHRPIKDVFLLEHLDCGAYKYLHPDDDVKKDYPVASREGMTEFHRHELNEFAVEVKRFCDYQLSQAEMEYEAARKACEACKPTEKGDEKKKPCWEHVMELAKEKADAWSDIRVSYFIMDLLGNVTQLDLPDGQRDSLKK